MARQMGIELVEGRDLVVHDNLVNIRTSPSLRRVGCDLQKNDDDELIDHSGVTPRQFRASASPALFNAYRAGNVSMANALGTRRG